MKHPILVLAGIWVVTILFCFLVAPAKAATKKPVITPDIALSFKTYAKDLAKVTKLTLHHCEFSPDKNTYACLFTRNKEGVGLVSITRLSRCNFYYMAVNAMGNSTTKIVNACQNGPKA